MRKREVFVFPANHWVRLESFLTAGSNGDEIVKQAVAEDGPRAVRAVLKAGEAGNARKSAALFALAVAAVLSPILGAVADLAGIKKKMLGSFLGLGVIATACMFFIEQGDWQLGAGLFILGNIGAAGSFVFYDSLLPHIASHREIDRVSTAGYALGYLGGGLLLAINLAWIQRPELFGIEGQGLATRLSFLSVALWWLGASV